MIVAANVHTLDLNDQIADLKLTIAKMQRDTHGAPTEKCARRLDQLQLLFDELITATVAEGAGHVRRFPSQTRDSGGGLRSAR
jgi:hypothetical protein